MKFLAFQVIEVEKMSQADKGFWDWWFSLFPWNSLSSVKFKQYSELWICFLCFKSRFWKQFALWFKAYGDKVIDYAKNEYMRERTVKWNKFLKLLIDKTKGLSFQRTETLYVAFLASMSKFSSIRETMIDDVAVEIEKYDPNNDPQGNELKKLKLPK